MSVQAPVGLSSQTGVSFTAPPPLATYLPHLFDVCFLPLKLWSTESLILPSCPDGAFDQYYSCVLVLESIVRLVLTKVVKLSCRGGRKPHNPF